MVSATLNFIKLLDRYETEKPYFLNIVGEKSAQDVRLTNLEYSPYEDIQIEDIRERGLNTFSIDRNGFKVIKSESSAVKIPIEESEIKAYCDEMVQLVSDEFQAAHAICYDYRLRRNNIEVLDYETGQDTGRINAAPPVFPAHIDHTVGGGPKRIRRHLTEEEAATYLNESYKARIVNVWRPLNNPAIDSPLALCDSRSVDPHDLLEADRVTPDFAVELYYLRHNLNQKWYWLRDQTPDELFLFVNYDSDCTIDGPQWRACPHAAFKNPEAPAGTPLRTSIEFRVIVFTPTN